MLTLKKAHQRLGSLAAASYNRGMAGVARLLKKQQADSYFDLLLGTETKRYIFASWPLKQLLRHLNIMGFLLKMPRNMPLCRTVEVDTAIGNIARFSKQMGVNYKTMKLYNPWLLQNHLNNKSRKLYHIALPEEVGP